jgi:hypothetical protein
MIVGEIKMLVNLPPKETIKNPYFPGQAKFTCLDAATASITMVDAVYSAAKPITADKINEAFALFQRDKILREETFGDYLMDYLKEEKE